MNRTTCVEAVKLLTAYWPKAYPENMSDMRRTALEDGISNGLWQYDDKDVIDAITRLAQSSRKAPIVDDIEKECKRGFDTYVHGDNKGDDQLWVLWDEYVPELCGKSETHYTDFVMTYRKVKQLFSPMKIEELERKRKLEVFNG